MTDVKILYDCHPQLVTGAKLTKKKLEEKYDIQISMVLSGSRDDVYEKLRSNPNYDFVILHLSGEGENSYRVADNCRRLTEAVLVAESSICPHNSSEILSHFDEYIGLVYGLQFTPLEGLLKDYGFVPDDGRDEGF